MTSCIEACESRVEYVGGDVMRCTSPPRTLPPGADNETVTVRVKLNGQDMFPRCVTYDCNTYEPAALQFTYYSQPVVTRITPNGGPLTDESFVFVTGKGFLRFGWYPRCLFGRQTTIRMRNSTTYVGWVSDLLQTNTSAYVVNDTLLVCYAPRLPADAPRLLDQEAGRVVHVDVLGAAFPGRDGRLQTLEDNEILPGSGSGRVISAFSITLNSQDFINTPGRPFPQQYMHGVLVEPTLMRFIYYPHPILTISIPLGGDRRGRTQVVVKGTGFAAFNEMTLWRGQFESHEAQIPCDINATNATNSSNRSNCTRMFWYSGTSNPNWFNDTQSTPRPPYVTSDALGWPHRDRNVAADYSNTTSTSIRCRFGAASHTGYKTDVTSGFYGRLVRAEPVYNHSVYADFLDSHTLRCRAPENTVGIKMLEVSLNGREYSDTGAVPYNYYESPHTHRLRPSGGPVEGGTSVTIHGVGFSRYEETPLCRFGNEASYDSVWDILRPLRNTTSVATLVNDTIVTCNVPFRLVPIVAPFSVSLNGQDFNIGETFCLQKNPKQELWDDPSNPSKIMPSVVNYTNLDTLSTQLSTCPYVFYRHPTMFALQPAGGPITGKSNVRVFGRGFNIFSEDVRCKFGRQTIMWVNAHDRRKGDWGRDDEVLCYTPPKLMVVLRGPDVVCTYGCEAFPDDAERCQPDVCDFRLPSKIRAFKLTVAEIVGVRDIFGDINVLPEDVTIESVKQPRDPYTKVGSLGVQVAFCVHCTKENVTQTVVNNAFRLVDAVRKGKFQAFLKAFGMHNVEYIEVSTEPVEVAVSLNGQDYTYRANSIFSYYMSPTIFGITPAGGPLYRYSIEERARRVPTRVEVGGIGMLNYDEKAECRFGSIVVPSTVIGDSLMVCETPWPGVLFREGQCDSGGGGGCVLDVWVEVTLNGADFTVESQVNYRYFLQPSFPTFSPLGGPVEGGTLVTFFGKGFNRFNDGSLRIQWGLYRMFPEEGPGPTQVQSRIRLCISVDSFFHGI